ncbi:flagellar biosynthesis repressor FlbT [Sphingomonas humi]|uniref:Flagellar biosynthesis repressor FlbT n=1 Tax=Sphingomonas humi TaxID=335630 RepID=A0ABP7RRE6_9SPHN
MTLRISLRDGEKVVINGAVIRSSGRTDLAIESKVTILRGREIMGPAEATTPARALYFHTMMAYLDPDGVSRHHDAIIETLSTVGRLATCEAGRAAVAGFASRAAAANYYRALGECRTLMRLEQEALAAVAEEAA